MVKVITEGNPGWQVSCAKGCKSVLEATEADLLCTIDSDGDATLHIICPVCGIRVYGFRDIPHEIRARVIEKARRK